MTTVARRLAEHRKIDRRHPVVRVAQDGQPGLVVARGGERQPAAVDGSGSEKKFARGEGFRCAGFEVAAFQGDAIGPGAKTQSQPADQVGEIGRGFEFFDGVARPVYTLAGVSPKIHIGLRVGLPVAEVLRKYGQQALPQVQAGRLVAIFPGLVAPQDGFRVGIQRQRRLDQAMVQVGDQRGERVVGAPADSSLAGRAGVKAGHAGCGDPDPLQFVILEGKAVGAPTHAEPSQAGTLEGQEAIRLQGE